jgi:hypothetical protein
MSHRRGSGGVGRSDTDVSRQVAPAASTSSTQSDNKHAAAARQVGATAVSQDKGGEIHDDTTHGDEASVTATSHAFWRPLPPSFDIEADRAAVAAAATATAARREAQADEQRRLDEERARAIAAARREAQADEQRRLDEERARAVAAARAGMTSHVAYSDGAVAVNDAADTATSGSTDTGSSSSIITNTDTATNIITNTNTIGKSNHALVPVIV